MKCKCNLRPFCLSEMHQEQSVLVLESDLSSCRRYEVPGSGESGQHTFDVDRS